MNMSDRVDRSEKHKNGMGIADGKVSGGRCRSVKKKLSEAKSKD